MAIAFHLKQFDGPLDLLLHLISKAKIEPQDIFVSEITEQYIQLLHQADDFDMEEASEFIQMAALLVEIKSRRLLPKPPKEAEQEDDPEQVLIHQLEAYKQFKESASRMAEFEKCALDIFGKLPEELPPPEPIIEWHGLTLEGLWKALLSVTDRKPREVTDSVIFRTRDIHRDMFSVDECIETIQSQVKFGKREFSSFFSTNPTREEAVTLFLAMLELLKQGKIHVAQDATFGRMIVYPGPGKIKAGDA